MDKENINDMPLIDAPAKAEEEKINPGVTGQLWVGPLPDNIYRQSPPPEITYLAQK